MSDKQTAKGMKVGPWISARLREAADRALDGEARPPGMAPDLTQDLVTIAARQRHRAAEAVNAALKRIGFDI